MKLHPRVSRSLVERIKRFEGFRRRSARLPSGGWTVGYGHVRTAREGVSVSAEDAEALLYYDLSEVAEKVEAWTFAPLNQNQFEALTSFAFNIGVDNFRISTALKRFNEGQPLLAAEALELWRRAEIGGEDLVVDALVRRRAHEKALFLTPPEGFRPSPTPVLAPRFDRDALSPRHLGAEEAGASAQAPPEAPGDVSASLQVPPEPLESPGLHAHAVEAAPTAPTAPDAVPQMARGDAPRTEEASSLPATSTETVGGAAADLSPTPLFTAANDATGEALRQTAPQSEEAGTSPPDEPGEPAPEALTTPGEADDPSFDGAFDDRMEGSRLAPERFTLNRQAGDPDAAPSAAAAAARRRRGAQARTAALFLIAGLIGFVLVVLASVAVTTGQASAASLVTGALGVIGLTIGFGGFMLRSRGPV